MVLLFLTVQYTTTSALFGYVGENMISKFVLKENELGLEKWISDLDSAGTLLDQSQTQHILSKEVLTFAGNCLITIWILSFYQKKGCLVMALYKNLTLII